MTGFAGLGVDGTQVWHCTHLKSQCSPDRVTETPDQVDTQSPGQRDGTIEQMGQPRQAGALPMAFVVS